MDVVGYLSGIWMSYRVVSCRIVSLSLDRGRRGKEVK